MSGKTTGLRELVMRRLDPDIWLILRGSSELTLEGILKSVLTHTYLQGAVDVLTGQEADK